MLSDRVSAVGGERYARFVALFMKALLAADIDGVIYRCQANDIELCEYGFSVVRASGSCNWSQSDG